MWQSTSSIISSLIGGIIVQYTQARYGFLVYACVSFGGVLSACKMSPKLEEANIKAGNVLGLTEGDDNSQQSTFLSRVKHDYMIIKENLKTKVVFRYYLFWLLYGMVPTFSGMDYY
jgi:hypothetical protein